MTTTTTPFRPLTLSTLLALAFAPAAVFAQQQDVQQITVTGNGRGQSRQVEFVSSAELRQLPPGSSPLAAVSRLPSVNFQSADAFGSYEWSTRLTVRGFNQNQLGFTLDDIPLGDMSYANFNGLHISRAIPTENIARSVLSAGTGSVSTASTSNLGGTLQFYSVDPSKTFGGEGNVGFGSHKTSHVFAKLETGDMGPVRAYVSISDQRSDKWKGAGQHKQQQLNGKLLADLGGAGRLTLSGNWSERREVDYQDLSHEMIHRLGWNWDNTFPNFARAVTISNTLCGNGGSTYVSACDDAYYAGAGLRDDDLISLAYDGSFGNTAVRATAYHHKNKGMGLWFTPYVSSPNGTPISLRTTEYGIDRNGVVASVETGIGMHTVKAAIWLESNKFNQARRFYSTSPTNVPAVDEFPSNPFATQWQYALKTDTTQFSLEDTLDIGGGAKLNIGFKSVDIQTTATRQIGDPASNPQGSIKARKGFLPQISLNLPLSKTSELFAGYAENQRAYQASRTGLSPYSTTQAGFDAIAPRLKPETSQTLEGGFRYNTREIEALAAVYLVTFKDRLLAIQQGPGIVGNPAVLANVGDARLMGLELSASARLGGGFSWYNGLSLNQSEYRSDYTSNGVTFATAGKTLVDTPKVMFKSVLSYEMAGFFGNVGLDHMGKRYYTYLNQGEVDARTLLNASVGYRLANLAGLKEASLQLSVTNLSDQRYVSTVGSNGFVNSDPTGTVQTLLAGAPRAVFLSFSAKL